MYFVDQLLLISLGLLQLTFSALSTSAYMYMHVCVWYSILCEHKKASYKHLGLHRLQCPTCSPFDVSEVFFSVEGRPYQTG